MEFANPTPPTVHLDFEYSGYEEHSHYYLYNFPPVTTSENE